MLGEGKGKKTVSWFYRTLYERNKRKREIKRNYQSHSGSQNSEIIPIKLHFDLGFIISSLLLMDACMYIHYVEYTLFLHREYNTYRITGACHVGRGQLK